MTSKELLKEIEAWLSINTEPSRKETANLRKSIKNHLAALDVHQCIFYSDADWTKLKCECGKYQLL